MALHIYRRGIYIQFTSRFTTKECSFRSSHYKRQIHANILLIKQRMDLRYGELLGKILHIMIVFYLSRILEQGSKAGTEIISRHHSSMTSQAHAWFL